jgi:hypothetical protein
MIGARHTVPDKATIDMAKAVFPEPILKAYPVHSASRVDFARKKSSERNPKIASVLATVVFAIYTYV